MFDLSKYTTCQERLNEFWKTYPNGRIETELLEHTKDRFVVMASVFQTVDDDKALSTGLAQEEVGSSNINKNFALENCETSAISRCLANANIGVDKNDLAGTRPSREEMEKVARVENDKRAAVKPFAQKLAEKITVENVDDPWTIKPIDESAPAQDAVQLVKDVLGGKTQEDIPSCKHGEMVWKHGVSQKNKKPWGQFRCVKQGPTGPGAEAFCDPIWYMISDDGSWKPQVKW